MKTTGARQRSRALVAGCAILLVAALFAGGATGAPGKSQATTVSLTVGVLSRVVQHLVSLSTGVLLATALLSVLPEAFEGHAPPQALFATLLAGLLFFFLLEKAELYRHGHHHEHDEHHHHHGFDAHQAGRGGWSVLLDTLRSLGPDDLAKTVTIRGEPHTVPLALARSLGHTCYHVGQIVQVARIHAGDNWQILTIPRGKSQQYNQVNWGQPGRSHS